MPEAKRILVISDTHLSEAAWRGALSVAGPIDMAFHLGDNVSDARKMERELAKTGTPLYCVKGNCDFSGAEDEQLVTVCGWRLWLTHGHKFGVKYGLGRLFYAAREREADAALFGHTHQPCEEYMEGCLLLNPGSAARPRGVHPTFALLEVSRDGIRSRIVAMD